MVVNVFPRQSKSDIFASVRKTTSDSIVKNVWNAASRMHVTWPDDASISLTMGIDVNVSLEGLASFVKKVWDKI